MNAGVDFLVLGSNGLVGSALVRALNRQGASYKAATRADGNLNDENSVKNLIEKTRPQAIVMAAAKVGGIMANLNHPVQFLSENILSQTYVMNAAHHYGVERLVFLGSSCIYPKNAPQPISEGTLLTGILEKTNEPYAIAKIAGIKLLQGYRSQYGRKWISVMPTNLYGINDNFDLRNSHVLAALIRKFHDAKISHASTVELWGSGTPRREFMNSDDLASAILFLLDKYDSDEPINIGTGKDISIRELADLVKGIVGFQGEILWNQAIPDGTFQKLLDVSNLKNLGWEPEISLRDGIIQTYEWFKTNYEDTRLSVPIA